MAKIEFEDGKSLSMSIIWWILAAVLSVAAWGAKGHFDDLQQAINNVAARSADHERLDAHPGTAKEVAVLQVEVAHVKDDVKALKEGQKELLDSQNRVAVGVEQLLHDEQFLHDLHERDRKGK